MKSIDKSTGLKSILLSLSDSFAKDIAEKSKATVSDEMFNELKVLIDNNNIEDFYFNFCYELESVIEGVALRLGLNDDAVFMICNYQMIENFFTKDITKHEGSPCSADKSRTIINSLFKFFTCNKEIEFDYDQKHTYHLPKKVMNRHDEIIDFYNAIKEFYYGNPEKYLFSMQKWRL